MTYTVRGMTGLLHRFGFTYKKAKLVPGKADASAQATFMADYEKLKENSGEGDVVMFMDATHPQYIPVLGCGWSVRGEEHPIRSNTGRRRLKINGTIDIPTMSAQIRFDSMIDAESIVALLEQIGQAYPRAPRITVICDNARYCRSKRVRPFKDSRIELFFLPPYSSKLRLIERFREFFKRQVLYNRYYEAFDAFRAGCKDLFANFDSYALQLCTLLTEYFEIGRY